jgi:hypothetical protein
MKQMKNFEILLPQEHSLGCRPPWRELEGQAHDASQEEFPHRPPVLMVAYYLMYLSLHQVEDNPTLSGQEMEEEEKKLLVVPL